MSAATLEQVPQAALDELVRRAADVAGFPIAWISLVEREHERVRARVGVDFSDLGLDRSFALQERPGRALFIADAAATRWRAHPLVAGAPHARFVGVLPLVGSSGEVLGALTVMDHAPRVLFPDERTALANIASLAVARVEALRGPVVRVKADPL